MIFSKNLCSWKLDLLNTCSGEIVVTIHRRADGEAVSPKESTFDKDFTGVKLGTAIAEPAAQASTFYSKSSSPSLPLHDLPARLLRRTQTAS